MFLPRPRWVQPSLSRPPLRQSEHSGARELIEVKGWQERHVPPAAPAHAVPVDQGGNTIGQSNALFETYTPVRLAAVRQADEARKKGREKLKKKDG